MNIDDLRDPDPPEPDPARLELIIREGRRRRGRRRIRTGTVTVAAGILIIVGGVMLLGSDRGESDVRIASSSTVSPSVAADTRDEVVDAVVAYVEATESVFLDDEKARRAVSPPRMSPQVRAQFDEQVADNENLSEKRDIVYGSVSATGTIGEFDIDEESGRVEALVWVTTDGTYVNGPHFGSGLPIEVTYASDTGELLTLHEYKTSELHASPELAERLARTNPAAHPSDQTGSSTP